MGQPVEVQVLSPAPSTTRFFVESGIFIFKYSSSTWQANKLILGLPRTRGTSSSRYFYF